MMTYMTIAGDGPFPTSPSISCTRGSTCSTQPPFPTTGCCVKADCLARDVYRVEDGAGSDVGDEGGDAGDKDGDADAGGDGGDGDDEGGDDDEGDGDIESAGVC